MNENVLQTIRAGMDTLSQRLYWTIMTARRL